MNQERMDGPSSGPSSGPSWKRYQSSLIAVLGFVLVVWVALMVTAPSSGSPGRPVPAAPAATTPECPPSAPNAAAGCMVLVSPR